MYTKITRAKHGASAIAYVLKEKGHFQDKRNDLLGYVNLTPHMDVTKQMGHYWKYASSRHKVQIRRVIVSFTERECARDDECRKQEVMEMAKSGLSKMYPDRQILLALQTDGKSGLVHIHGLVNDVSMTDHKGIPSKENNFKFLKENLNKHMQESGFILDYGKKRSESRKSQYQKYLEDAGRYSWRKDLRERVLTAYKKATDKTSFITELNARGVDYNDSDKRKYCSFTLMDFSYYDQNGLKHPQKKLTARGDKLDIRLTKDNLGEHFFNKRKAHAISVKDALNENNHMKTCEVSEMKKYAEKEQISESRWKMLDQILDESKKDYKGKKKAQITYIKKEILRTKTQELSVRKRTKTKQDDYDYGF